MYKNSIFGNTYFIKKKSFFGNNRDPCNGWVELNQAFLPVVYRGEDKVKFVSQRAVEKILISTFKEIPRAAILCAEVTQLICFNFYFTITSWLGGRCPDDESRS